MLYLKTLVTPLLYAFTFLVALKLSTGTLGVIIGWCDRTNKVCQIGPDKWVWGFFLGSVILLCTSGARIWLFIKRVKLAWYKVKIEQLDGVIEKSWKKKDAITSVTAYAAQEVYATRLRALKRPVEKTSTEIAGEIIVSGDPISWIESQSVDIRHFIGIHWNWDYDLTILRAIVNQPDCDAATAASVFWLAGTADDQFPFGTEAPTSPEDILVYEMTKSIALRFQEKTINSGGFSFSEDWGHIFELPEKRFSEGLLNWNPGHVPKSISGRAVNLSDFSGQKQAEIKAFLSKFGTFV